MRLRRAAPVVEHSRHHLMPAALHDADVALFDRIAALHSPPLDATLPRLSHAANNARLWLGIAAVLAAVGRRRERRAALRGTLAVALTSAITNGPLKLAVRRKRPPLALVPLGRQVRRKPTTSSFPSGHAASAAAFATAVALEQPLVAVPIAVVAGGVALSRIYNGAHYPSDVVVGAGLGAGVAYATTRVWPRNEDEPGRTRVAPLTEHTEPAPDGAGLTVVVNPASGPALKADHPAALRAALPAAHVVELSDPDELGSALTDAARSARAIGVVGGDGSVNRAAQVAYDADKPLVVVPGGTLNHLARDLGVASVDDVTDAVRRGETAAIDVAQIDDHPFLNTASFGSYVEFVDARERLENHIGKWPAVVVALVRVLARGKPVDVEIDGRPMTVWMSFIGNCRYEPVGFAPSWRERLDDGELDVRLVRADVPFARLRILLAVLTGRLARSAAYEERSATRVHVRSLGAPLRLAHDGETFEGSTEFVVEKLPKRLAVFAPCVP
ncbi:MAG: bifunctional phosphatase PAP2/diacylglycerol kinase family protein [Mycobacteriales bacterium]|nr:phosphatase PAP2 family protein [Frankia sp.]